MRNLIAILRGIHPHEVLPITEILLDIGIARIEVPLNSPEPFDSIALLIQNFKNKGIFGAGTVLNVKQVQTLADIGADMVVSPNCNPTVIKATKAAGMLSFPGVMTPTECFTALDAGADGLKFFPGDILHPQGLKAIQTVLPTGLNCIAVGGAKPAQFAEWVAAGATGFGIGSALYKAGDTPEEVERKAKAIVAAYDRAKP